MPATKSTKFGSRYLREGSSKREEILQVARWGLVYLTTHGRPVTFGPWGAKILKGVKNCNAFLKGGFIDLDKIWHNGGLKG